MGGFWVSYAELTRSILFGREFQAGVSKEGWKAAEMTISAPGWAGVRWVGFVGGGDDGSEWLAWGASLTPG
jgi:hypothetical protein